FEYNRLELVSHTQKNDESPTSVFYTYDDFFPSVNSAYRLNDKHQFRLSYCSTVNSAVFREVSCSVFYDFYLASNVQ
ncbi:outer membrane beta-barrel family protein, partial [Phocaeicola vulgatus]|uniref:outer membrane beta-barrel family protein n=1 Tax=Phocaeicola vulgatus TaxID=821 RepID=UPI00210EE889